VSEFLWQPVNHCMVTFLALTETTPVDESLVSDHVPVKNSVTEGQIISLTINNSTIKIKESVKTPVKVVKEDVNKTVVAHHAPHASPAQTYVTKKSYASIVSELLCSLISFATLLDVLMNRVLYC
jgi:hypothetical protein